jgi:hypothetical protein
LKKQREGKNKEGFDLWTLAENSKNPVLILIAGIAVYIFVKKNPDVLPESSTTKKRFPWSPSEKKTERSWMMYFSTQLSQSLAFLVKNPQYLAILFLVFLFKDKILQFLMNSSKRKENLDYLYDLLNKQTDQLKNVYQSNFDKLNTWTTQFFSKINEYNEKDANRLISLEKDLKVANKKILDFVDKLHSRDKDVIHVENALETCSNAYESAMKNGQSCVKQYNQMLDTAQKTGVLNDKVITQIPGFGEVQNFTKKK